MTGVSFASAGSGFDPLTPRVSVRLSLSLSHTHTHTHTHTNTQHIIVAIYLMSRKNFNGIRLGDTHIDN
jgi:hypothetical protein